MGEFKHVVGFVAGALIAIAQLRYIYQIIKRTISPSILSWFGWAILMGTSLVSQLVFKGWSPNLIGLSFSATGCLTIFITALILKNYKYEKADLQFLYYGIVCNVIYAIAKNVWLTTAFAIFADFILAIPLIKSAYQNPQKEKSPAWPLAFTSWIFSMTLLCFDFSWIYAIWPIYLILFNAMMTYLVYVRRELGEK